MKKRIISLIIAVILCVAMIVPASVNADVDENLPYFEKLVAVDGDTVTLTVTLRGPDKSCAGGQVNIEYPAAKLTYQCPGVNPDNTEMWDEELPWLGIGNGNINGHTDPGLFIVNFFSARGVKTNQVLCEVQFKITEGQTINAADFVISEDTISDAVGELVVNPAPITFTCTHKAYAADPESSVAPTCSTAGKTVEKCTSCGDAKETEVPATGIHDFKLDETKSIPATETTDGVSFYACANCDETKTEKVDKTGVVDANPYHEKVFRTVGNKVTLTITLRGPKAALGGQFAIGYNTEKLEYVTPGVDEEGIEIYDNPDWLVGKSGNVNGLTEPGTVYANYYSPRANNPGSVVVVIEFNVKSGAKIEESDFTVIEDLAFDENGDENQKASAPIFIFCEHTNYTEKTDEYAAPTCTEAGAKVYYCDVCGDKKVEEVPALGHDYSTVTVDPTCDKVGTATTTCSRCDYENVVETPALGHDLSSTTVDATCTADGATTTTCSRCDYEKVEVIPALGHDEKTTTVDATCEAEGSVTTTCSRCDYEKVEVIPALGHKFSDPVVTKEPTCTETGVETGTCSVCGKTTEQDIPALGHDLTTETVDATCADDGSKTTTCSRCDYEDVEVIPATGNHDYVLNENESTAAECEKAGENVYYCSVCRDKKTEAVDALEHIVYDEDIDEELSVEPTCTEDGKLVGVCSVCNDEVEAVVPALGHDYDEGTVTKEPTETEEGEKTYKCSRCDEVKVEKIAKLDPKPVEDNKAPAGDSTGDTAQVLLVSIIAVLSLAVLATIVFKNKATN